MLNIVTLQGRLTKEPELRQTTGGKSVVNLTLAVENDVAGADGVRGCEFIDCTAWAKSAEFISKYFSKGSMMIASGRLHMESFEDRDGKKRTRAKVIILNAYFGGSAQAKPEVEADPPEFTEYAEADGDLPF